jgi:hypothetical protein
MVAQAGLALTVAADQASQDEAWAAEDDRQKSEVSFDAGRLRREAAEHESAFGSDADHDSVAESVDDERGVEL